MSHAEPFALAARHYQAGRIDEAEVACRKVLAANPAHADAWALLGIIALQLNAYSAAVECLERSVSLNPNDVGAQNNLGLALHKEGNLSGAAIHFRCASDLAPQLAEVQFNLAHVLHELGDLNTALTHYKLTLSLKSDFAEAWLNAANIFSSQGQFERAIEYYRRAFELSPRKPDALMNFGAALQRMGRSRDAAAAYRQAIALRPDSAEAYNGLGIALRFLGSIDESVAAFRRALELDPDKVEALNNLGNSLKDAGLLDEALNCRRQAIARRPDFISAYSNFLYSIQFSPKYDAASIYQEHSRWNKSYAAGLEALGGSFPSNPEGHRRLRIGYVSPHFRHHTLAFALVPLLRSHDRANFEINCYHDEPVEDEITHQLRGYADAWHNIVGLTDEQVAGRVKSDQIDILVDLTMHMSGARPLLFARKPAPIQICWLAYPGTTGLTAMDYRLTDPYLDPPGLSDEYYSEKSFRLPHTFWCYDPLSHRPPVNELPALKNGFITFGSLNNPCKTNDGVFDLWARVLHAVNDSRLMLLVNEISHGNRLRGAFRERGVEPDRICPVTLRARPQYLELYQQIDIGLDTFPYNGHNTSLDSYWMGVPVVTLVGDTVAGRAGLSQLSNLKLNELIARTADQYVSIACSLACDLQRLITLRSFLRQRIKDSPIMNASQFTRDVEAAYRQIWRWSLEKRNTG